jgi:NADPH:quinone reductase-like Zn-dependent oxidoreductase
MMHDRFPATFPSGEGSDLAGVVERVGDGVDSFKPGDEVIGVRPRIRSIAYGTHTASSSTAIRTARSCSPSRSSLIPRRETARLLLRGFEEGDLDAHASMSADPEVMRLIGPGETLDRAGAWRSVAMRIGDWELRGYGQWALIEAASSSAARQHGFDPGSTARWWGHSRRALCRSQAGAAPTLRLRRRPVA